MDNKMKPIRGSARLPITVGILSSAAEILDKGVQKLSAHNQHFAELYPSPYLLAYPDGSLVTNLPEGGEFTLEAYKQQIGKEYGRITLYVLSKECLGMFTYVSIIPSVYVNRWFSSQLTNRPIC